MIWDVLYAYVLGGNGYVMEMDTRWIRGGGNGYDVFYIIASYMSLIYSLPWMLS